MVGCEWYSRFEQTEAEIIHAIKEFKNLQPLLATITKIINLVNRLLPARSSLLKSSILKQSSRLFHTGYSVPELRSGKGRFKNSESFQLKNQYGVPVRSTGKSWQEP